ncbi:MAG: hypothetical protein ABIG60_00725 [Patescibacteria group bacterium]
MEWHKNLVIEFSSSLQLNIILVRIIVFSLASAILSFFIFFYGFLVVIPVIYPAILPEFLISVKKILLFSVGISIIVYFITMLVCAAIKPKDFNQLLKTFHCIFQ